MVAVVKDFSFYVFGGGVCPPGTNSAVGYCSEFDVERGSRFLNDLFRFSTKDQKWEQIDVRSSPSARSRVSMVNTVGSDLYMFGGYCTVTHR